jgi:integrase/recombinase XerC
MTTTTTLVAAPAAPSIPASTDQAALRRAAAELWRLHCLDKSEKSIRAYAGDWRDIAAFLEGRGLIARLDDGGRIVRAIAALIQAGPHMTGSLFREYLADRRDTLSPATRVRRRAALKTLFADAQKFGLIDWQPELGKRQRVTAYRDTRGCGTPGFRKILARTDSGHPRDVRDRAILWLLYALALRAGSVRSLDLADYEPADPDRDTPAILRVTLKGRADEAPTEKPLPPRVAEALDAWLAVRRTWGAEGPMFVGLQADGLPTSLPPQRLAERMLWKITRRLGVSAGVKRNNPHAFRHAGATAALEATGGDLSAVQAMLDHESPQHTRRYLDNLEARGAGAVATVAEAV